MVGEADYQQPEPRVIVSDGTIATLDRLIEDPAFYVNCIYDGMIADAIFVTPEGTDIKPDVRVAPLCARHIGKETQSPMIPIVDMTNGFWSQYFGYTQLMQRDKLEGYQELLAAELSDEEYAEYFPPDPENQPRRWQKIIGHIIKSHDD